MTDQPPIERPHLPTRRVALGRILDLSERIPNAPTQPPPPPAEGVFDYGEPGLGNTHRIRYFRMKAVEGQPTAMEWILDQVAQFDLAGATEQDVAKTFGFSVDFCRNLIRASRLRMKTKMLDQFDGSNWLAQQMALYQHARQKSFTVFINPHVVPLERLRSHIMLMNTMKQEAEFVSKVGGLKGISVNPNVADAASQAANEMSQSLGELTRALEELAAMEDMEEAEALEAEVSNDDG